jgi:hypothetical protein
MPKTAVRGEPKGLAVRVNLWPVESQTNIRQAKRFICGKATNTTTGETKVFNDAGELLTILGKWNAQKFKALPKRAAGV